MILFINPSIYGHGSVVGLVLLLCNQKFVYMSPICVCMRVCMFVCILLEATSFLKAFLSFYQTAMLRPITPYYLSSTP
jgi:hypothetical protein